MQKIFALVCVAGVVLLLLLSVSVRYGLNQRADRERLEKNQQALLEENERYRINDSLNAYSSALLSVKMSEFKENFSQLHANIKELGLRMKRVESVTSTLAQSNYQITTPVVDSVVFSQMAGTIEKDTLKTVRYDSPHISLSGYIQDHLFTGEIATYDTLTQVVHRIPRRFLFLRWGTKQLRQEIYSSNPHTHITYSRVIEIRK